jgi:hypothetical protein
MYKVVTPSNTVQNYYDLYFSSPIYTTTSSESVLESTSFLINGIEHFFGDYPIINSNNRRITIYKIVNGARVIVNSEAGIIYTATGRIVINNFKPDTTAEIRLTVLPNSLDLAPKRNQLLSISPFFTEVNGEVDTIAVSGSSGTVDYTTTSRHK